MALQTRFWTVLGSNENPYSISLAFAMVCPFVSHVWLIVFELSTICVKNVLYLAGFAKQRVFICCSKFVLHRVGIQLASIWHVNGICCVFVQMISRLWPFVHDLAPNCPKYLKRYEYFTKITMDMYSKGSSWAILC